MEFVPASESSTGHEHPGELPRKKQYGNERDLLAIPRAIPFYSLLWGMLTFSRRLDALCPCRLKAGWDLNWKRLGKPERNRYKGALHRSAWR
jgi:hypothetical protein